MCLSKRLATLNSNDLQSPFHNFKPTLPKRTCKFAQMQRRTQNQLRISRTTLGQSCNDVCSSIPTRHLLCLLTQNLRVVAEFLSLLARIKQPHHSLANTIWCPGRGRLGAAPHAKSGGLDKRGKAIEVQPQRKDHMGDTRQDGLVIAVGAAVVHEGHDLATL